MSKNLIPIIAKELGVEIGEPFKIVGNGDSLWRFTETNFQFYGKHFQDGWVNVKPQSVAILVLETPEIIKLPFDPQDDEHYWTYQGNGFWIVETDWMGLANEYCKKACGCVFRTEEEAIKARPAKYKELTGKEWQDIEG